MEVYQNRITCMPNIINWVEMPGVLGELEYMELLKKSIFLHNHCGEIDRLLKWFKEVDDKSICFFNLDKLFFKNNIQSSKEISFVKNITPLLSKVFGYRALVHSSVIDRAIGDIFRSEGIAFLQTNLEDKRRAYSTILDMIRPYFSSNNKLLRSYLRVVLEGVEYKIQVMKYDKYIMPFEGILKDMSLNGVGIKLNRPYDANFFSLRDIVSVNIYIRHYKIRINAGVVTRINPDTKEIGINFDINNSKMISPMVADTISKLIYHYVEDMLLFA